MTVDPGSTGSGIAIWDEEEWDKRSNGSKKPIYPMYQGVLNREDKILYGLKKLIAVCNVRKAYVENAAYMGESLKGHMVAGGGKLVKLAEFIGKVLNIFEDYGVEAELVNPQKWKGTMTKQAVIKRICKRCPNMEGDSHSWDAIGLGLYVMGIF
jgi:hypothetical protein